MKKKKGQPFESVSPKKRVLVLIVLLGSFIGGGMTAGIAVNNIRNYNNPLLFGITFGTIGLLVGLYAAKKLKPIIAISQQLRQYYNQLSIFIAIGFIGLTMLLAQQANTLLSIEEKCDNYSITKKIYKPRRVRRKEFFAILINIEGRSHRFSTK